MKSTMYVMLMIVAVTGTLSACSSKPTRADVEKQIAKVEQIREDAEEARIKKRQKRLEAELDEVPSWAIDVPRPDGYGLYAVGSGRSETLSLAGKKAMLDAEWGLAKATRQEVSGSERTMTSERGDRGGTTSYTALVDKLVTNVPVVGYEVIKHETKPLRGVYNTWVLLKMPYAEFNKALQDQRNAASDKETRAAFDDLERRVKARQAERLHEEQARHAMRIQELETRAAAINKLDGLGTVRSESTITESTKQ